MQANYQPLTPQKKELHNHSSQEGTLLKELCSLILTVSSSNLGKPHLEMLQSPLPITKDLFTQLIGSEKAIVAEDDSLDYYDIPEEESSVDIDGDHNNESPLEESSFGDQCQDDQLNGIRKRKRKNNNQLKMLKLELIKEPKWGKDKIVQMASLTGLSQPQVYKWWWDQKKKHNKHQRNWQANRKLIQKDRSHHPQRHSIAMENDLSDQTKVKGEKVLDWIPDTDRKIQKRLMF